MNLRIGNQDLFKYNMLGNVAANFAQTQKSENGIDFFTNLHGAMNTNDSFDVSYEDLEAYLKENNDKVNPEKSYNNEEVEALLKGNNDKAETKGVNGAEGANGAEKTQATSTVDGEEAAKIQEEIDALEEEKEANLAKMDKIEAKIEKLTEEAEANIMQAAALQEQKVKEHEEKSQEAVQENIAAYIAANKEGGAGMTRDELQENIQGSLSDIPEVGNAISAAIAANDQLNEIDAHLGELNKLIQDTKNIETEIGLKQQEYTAAKEAEKCDPIGFTIGEGEDQVQYDFIVDDGSFDSTSDFLGAENQWAEMAALDTDGDNIVTAKELQAGNIKAVKTSADGTQEIVDLAEEFGDDFSINLASYQEGGSHSAIDTTSDKDGDGIADQELLGTFSLNVNGETISGYNTLDDVDYLTENYGLSSVSKSVSEEYSEDLLPHVNFLNTYTQKVKDLRESLKEAWNNLGLTDEMMNELNQQAVQEANQNAKSFHETLATEEEENKEESTTTQAEQGNTAATEATEKPEEKDTTTPTETDTDRRKKLLEMGNFFLAA